MSDTPCLHAEDHNALALALKEWGATAPERHERRGKQKLLERWCLNRYLRARNAHGETSFPLQVREDENPDFMICEGDRDYGIEVIEAVCPAEQQAMSRTESADIPEDWELGTRYLSMVHKAIGKKALKASSRCDELLVYLNTIDTIGENIGDRLDALQNLPDHHRFERIWLFKDAGPLLELVEGRNVPFGFNV